MTSIRPTLAICMIAGAVTAVGLFAPDRGDEASAPTVGAGDSPVVEIANFAFSGLDPIDNGAEVEVLNIDGVAHTLTATDQAFDTGVIDAGATATIRAPSTAGTYEFFCEIHPSMTGSLTVEGEAPLPETTIAQSSELSGDSTSPEATS